MDLEKLLILPTAPKTGDERYSLKFTTELENEPFSTWKGIQINLIFNIDIARKIY